MFSFFILEKDLAYSGVHMTIVCLYVEKFNSFKNSRFKSGCRMNQVRDPGPCSNLDGDYEKNKNVKAGTFLVVIINLNF